jgi:hypothetical protein
VGWRGGGRGDDGGGRGDGRFMGRKSELGRGGSGTVVHYCNALQDQERAIRLSSALQTQTIAYHQI